MAEILAPTPGYSDPRFDPATTDKPGQDPPPPSDFEEERLDREQRRQREQRMADLAEQSFGEEMTIARAREKELGPAYAALSGSARAYERASAQATERYMAAQRDVPEMKQPDIRGDAYQWMLAASVLGSLAGARSRQGATAALTAFTGAMQGFAKGDQEGFERNYKVWQANAERTYEMNARATREYQAVMSNAKLGFDTKANLIKMIAAKYDDQMMIPQAEQRHIERMTQLINAQDRANDNYYLRMETLKQHHDEFMQKQKMDAAKYGVQLDDSGQVLGIDKTPESAAYKTADMVAHYRIGPLQVGSGRTGQVNREIMALADEIAMNETGQHYQATTWTAKNTYARVAGGYGARVESATNELAFLIPQALQANDALPRGKWVPVNKAIQDVQQNGSKSAYYSLAAATQAVVTAWSKAMNPTGVPRLEDKTRAEKLLNAATSPEAYRAVVLRLAKEARASHAAIEATINPDQALDASQNVMKMTDQQLDAFIMGHPGTTTPALANLSAGIAGTLRVNVGTGQTEAGTGQPGVPTEDIDAVMKRLGLQ